MHHPLLSSPSLFVLTFDLLHSMLIPFAFAIASSPFIATAGAHHPGRTFDLVVSDALDSNPLTYASFTFRRPRVLQPSCVTGL